jgi:hypothetical protein
VTRITFQDGKVVLRDGKVGTEEACCCCSCPPCSDTFSFSVELGGLTATTNFCSDGGYTGQAFDFEDGFVLLAVSAGCDEGNWILSADLCYQVAGCSLSVRYEATVDCANVDGDGFPPAGAVAMQEVFRQEDPADCSGIVGPTAATISK